MAAAIAKEDAVTGPVLRLTEAAAQRAHDMIAARGRPTEGLRLTLRTAGCSGWSYALDFADQRSEQDGMIHDKGVTVFFDPEAASILAGTLVDYVEGDLSSRFVFRNPNERARCGCGESFLA